jgi:hypothetical protein
VPVCHLVDFVTVLNHEMVKWAAVVIIGSTAGGQMSEHSKEDDTVDGTLRMYILGH